MKTLRLLFFFFFANFLNPQFTRIAFFFFATVDQYNSLASEQQFKTLLVFMFFATIFSENFFF